MVTSNYSKGVNTNKLLQENLKKREEFLFFLTYFQKQRGLFSFLKNPP